MKKEKIKKCQKLVIILFLFFWVFLIVNASSINGEIDSIHKYAKGDNEVKINFGIFKGATSIIVTDTNLSGFAWGENIGWINLSPKNGGVLNNGEGALSGFASSETGGWVDFKGVFIDSNGDFSGYASSEKLGKIFFNCNSNNSCAIENFKVKTDWRPISFRKNTTPPSSAKIPLPAEKPSSISDSETKKTEDIIKKSLEENSIKPKPLPITNLDQYEGGGDIIRYNENVNKIEGGKITSIYNPSEEKTTDKVFNDASSQEKELQNTQINSNYRIMNIAEKTQEITSVIKKTTNEIKKDAKVVTENPSVNITTKAVTTVGVAGGSTVIATTFFSGLLSFSEVFLTIFRLWSILLSALGIKKRKKPWGTVYDSITKQPLDPAYVVLKDKSGKEIATSITDLDGRYGFFVPPGLYNIIVKKTNYIAPSIKLHGKNEDELYDNLYFGEDIELNNSKEIITKNIPMDPQGFDWNEFAKRNKSIMSFHSPRLKIFTQISNAFFYFGMALSLILLFIKFDFYNIIIVAIYVVLFIIKKNKLKQKSHGTISYKETHLPISFAIIRIFQKGNEKERFHRIADEYGHYYCLLPKGEYFVTIEKKNNDESYTKIYTSDVFFVKNGILQKDFVV